MHKKIPVIGVAVLTFKFFNLSVMCLGLPIILAGCNLCDESIVYQVPSPDSKYEVRVTWRNCGATTDYVTNIYIAKPGSEGGDNILRLTGGCPVGVHWIGNDHLIIKIPKAGSIAPQIGKVYRKSNSAGSFWHPIKISYEDVITTSPYPDDSYSFKPISD